MNFSPELANDKKLKEFEGALPTTIYQAAFSEVYGQSPDIDSTALMLSNNVLNFNQHLERRGRIPS
jgi:hypothetical protein